MSYLYESTKYGNNIIEVVYDSDPESPREWENVGTMDVLYRNLTIKESDIDYREIESEEQLLKAIHDDGALVILPLMIYDHSGLHIYVGTTGDRWDSSRVGYIYATEKSIIANFGADYDLAKVEELLRIEVELFDKYLKGEVYGYRIYAQTTCGSCHHIEKEEVDSCYGFFSPEDAMERAKEYILP